MAKLTWHQIQHLCVNTSTPHPHITCTSDASQPPPPYPNQIHRSTTIAPSHHQRLAAQEEVHKISIPPTSTPTKPPLECNNAAAPPTPLNYQKNTQTQQEQQNKHEKQPTTGRRKQTMKTDRK
jgi:hypothetical protein